MRNLTVDEAVKILRSRNTYEGDMDESLNLWADASGTIATAIAMGFYDVVPARMEDVVDRLTGLLHKKDDSQVDEVSRNQKIDDLIDDIFGISSEDEDDDMPGYND